MKYLIAAVLLAVGTARADDHVTIKYRPPPVPSARTVVVTIDRPFDKSGTLVPEVFQRLEAIHKLESKSFVIPDAGCITIIAEQNGKRLESSSCHTLFESNDRLVARSTGVSALEGVPREEVLSKEPKHFLEFRRLWEEALSMSMETVNEKLKVASRPANREVLNSPKDVMNTPGGPLSPASIKDLLQEPPIVALWLHEDHRRSRSTAPNLRMAIWNDGRVLSAQDPSKWGHQLELGRLTDDTLSKVKKQILDTGVFDLKGRLWHLVPSAPVYCLLVQLDGKRRLLCWDEVEGSGYGSNTNPTPDYLAFKKAWKSVNQLAVSAIPDDSVQVLERFETVPKPWYVERRMKSE